MPDILKPVAVETAIAPHPQQNQFCLDGRDAHSTSELGHKRRSLPPGRMSALPSVASARLLIRTTIDPRPAAGREPRSEKGPQNQGVVTMVVT
jgi:hypothetical protein